jgi:mRNA interferase RelE/StbE
LAWTVEFAKGVEKDLRRLDATRQRRVIAFLTQRVATHPDPRALAKKLHGPDYDGLWRFRVGDLRLTAEFHQDRLVVLILEIGDRAKIYR